MLGSRLSKADFTREYNGSIFVSQDLELGSALRSIVKETTGKVDGMWIIPFMESDLFYRLS